MHAVPMPEPFATALEAAGHRDGIHGHAHWRRVAENGLFVAQREGADPHAVLLFAILHDCRRQNDGHDPGHGPRAAELVEALGHEPLGIDPDTLATLAHAMRHHDRGQVSDHPLVGTCWDADRLDLPRVGITPNPVLMSTASGSDAEVIALFADHRRDAPTWQALATAALRT